MDESIVREAMHRMGWSRRFIDAHAAAFAKALGDARRFHTPPRGRGEDEDHSAERWGASHGQR